MLAAPSTSASLGTLVTQLIVAVGGFAGLASAINAVFSRRKTNAEASGLDASAAAVLSDTAAAQVERMDKRMAAQEKRIADLEVDIQSLRRRESAAAEREEGLTQQLRAWATWGALATATLSEHGIDIAAPPSYPEPHRTRPAPA